ncbi:protein kinase [Cystobacter fuscus]|uniref:protein kinase domain-containing protein n=1 Tax=Cystobacter fuscus TaxID=43 RepID=UPI002B324CBC|nr:protein kinase [Cystobacter fuscus]
MDEDKIASSSAQPPGTLPNGTVIAGRFILKSVAGWGGMGCVYRAADSSTGRTVALKLLHGVTSPERAYRFNREAVLLSELHHPGIVAYVAHGSTESHQPYLAMEWLEGEDLLRRLACQPLGLPETLSLLRQAAEALAVAHQQGIVHRDLKPSNLFMRAGRPEQVVLLDFGLARHAEPTLMAVTATGTVVGTAGYMAPEQASSAPEISPAADIFSLGCVLYECLTGRPPFAAPHFAAALAKILHAEPARLETLRPGLPAGLQWLVDCMLAKDPQRRLSDAASLLEALGTVESIPELLPPAGTQPRLNSGREAEQSLISVLLVSLEANSQEETTDWNQGLARRDSLRTDLAPLSGAQVELLADGSLVATLVAERGSATDQAALAARCALTLKERWPEAAVVLTMGLGVFNKRLPMGEAMDRAGRLLRQLECTPSVSVVMDDVTAGLLGPGFQLARSDSGAFVLQGERLDADASRPLLGKPTQCVGREQELALLDFTFTACVEESTARVLLVTAPPGTGKSRLRHEFLRRLESREQPPLVLLGRGDPMHTGASYGLLGQALRKLCEVGEGENLEARRTRLYLRVALHLPEARAQEAAEFLGELCAVPFPEEDSPRLRAARGDPRLMSTQVGRALVDFLKAECEQQPVLLVLEDLHWSDALTVTLVDGMLRELAGQPFLVLALARPEVKEVFPGLWARRLQELSLNGLSRKACARLAREVLGPQVPESVVQRAVEQSDGNALFLEELIRMAAEGRGKEAPKTVLAVLQARLLRMEHGIRQVLLACSIFGRTFWLEGVEVLLGRHTEQALLAQQLQILVEQEVIEPLPDSRFPIAAEYRFRHALVWDAAYGLVPESHRPLGHQLAVAWLERIGEPDALVLATHAQRGQQSERAVHFYTRAAERLFERNDLQGTLRCVEAALACEVGGEEIARLRALQAMVLFWMAQMSRAVDLGIPALAGLKAGSPLWCRLIGNLFVGGASVAHAEQMAGLGELLVRTSPEPEAVEAYLEAVSFMGGVLIWSGERQKVEALLGRLMEVGADVMTHSPMARGVVSLLQGYFLYCYEASPWRSFTVFEQGRRDFSAVGSERNINVIQVISAASLVAAGDLPDAVKLLREALAIARRTEQHFLVESTLFVLGSVLSRSPEQEERQEAHVWALDWVGRECAHPFIPGMIHALLAQMTAAGGALSEAESFARKACEMLVPFPVYMVFARTVLSEILRTQRRAAEARDVAKLGVAALERMRGKGVYAVGMYLALAEACFAQGDAAAGEETLRKALRCVRARASDFPAPEARERFLRQVPENARTLELARQHWGDATA